MFFKLPSVAEQRVHKNMNVCVYHQSPLHQLHRLLIKNGQIELRSLLLSVDRLLAAWLEVLVNYSLLLLRTSLIHVTRSLPIFRYWNKGCLTVLVKLFRVLAIHN